MATKFKALLVSKEASKAIGIKEGDMFYVAPYIPKAPYLGESLDLNLSPDYPFIQLESSADREAWMKENPKSVILPTAQFHFDQVSFIE